MIYEKCLYILWSAITIVACSGDTKLSAVSEVSHSVDSVGLVQDMEKHLHAVSSRDLATLDLLVKK